MKTYDDVTVHLFPTIYSETSCGSLYIGHDASVYITETSKCYHSDLDLFLC